MVNINNICLELSLKTKTHILGLDKFVEVDACGSNGITIYSRIKTNRENDDDTAAWGM